MARQSFTSPIHVLLIGVTLIVLVLAGAGVQSQAAPGRAPGNSPEETAAYAVGQTQTAVAAAPNQTAAASATAAYFVSKTQTGGSSNSATATATNTSTPTATTAGATATTGATAASTATSQSASAAPTLAATATAAPTPSRAPTPAPILSATPTLSATPLGELACVPGQPIEVTGSGPPNAGVLMYFNARAVGGGSVGADGRFALTLVVGNEAPGRYPVVVQVRGSTQVLRTLDCMVPATTPTPVATGLGR